METTERGKTSVRVTMNLTWNNRWQFFKLAFSPKKQVVLIDNNVGEVLVKETLTKHRNGGK